MTHDSSWHSAVNCSGGRAFSTVCQEVVCANFLRSRSAEVGRGQPIITKATEVVLKGEVVLKVPWTCTQIALPKQHLLPLSTSSTRSASFRRMWASFFPESWYEHVPWHSQAPRVPRCPCQATQSGRWSEPVENVLTDVKRPRGSAPLASLLIMLSPGLRVNLRSKKALSPAWKRSPRTSDPIKMWQGPLKWTFASPTPCLG